MRDSVPSPRYSAVCNVLRQWKTSLIPTYRVYRLYDKEVICSDNEKAVNLLYIQIKAYSNTLRTDMNNKK